VKANSPAGLQAAARADGFGEGGDFVIELSQAFSEFQQFASELALGVQHFAKANEGPERPQCNGPMQNASRHDRALFSAIKEQYIKEQ
jgi:hypothetical protein